jgi:RNA recognition motif-containing protein
MIVSWNSGPRAHPGTISTKVNGLNSTFVSARLIRPDSAYIFVGGLDYELTEGDVITVFSQYGEVMDVHLPREKETGKTKGFGFLMYEDQRSTVLAVDNLNGANLVGRTLRVDHVRDYKQPKEKGDDGEMVERDEPSMNARPELIMGTYLSGLQLHKVHMGYRRKRYRV